jgi:hypothetical protein
MPIGAGLSGRGKVRALLAQPSNALYALIDSHLRRLSN